MTAESELARLTAAGGPLRRTLAAIRARLLDTQAIERLCYARLRDYARERAGVSARQPQDLAHAHRAFATLPLLEHALVANELPWSKVRLRMRVATPEDESSWIERALLLRAGHGPAFERCLADPARARDPIPDDERQLCAPDVDVEATEQLAWRAPREVASLFLAVREAIRGRLRTGTKRPVSEGEAFSAMLAHALATWTLRDPSKPRPDPVFERDGYLCAVPGYSSRMSFHDHHVVLRAHQGSNDLSNLLTSCAFHHQRCLHAGRLRIRGFAPDRLVFELGVRPGAPPLARDRSGDVMSC